MEQHGGDRRRVAGAVEPADGVQHTDRRFAAIDHPEPLDGVRLAVLVACCSPCALRTGRSRADRRRRRRGSAPGSANRSVAIEADDDRAVGIDDDAVEHARRDLAGHGLQRPAAVGGSPSTRALPTRIGSASRSSRPACHSPAVWKHSSTSRGAVMSGRSLGTWLSGSGSASAATEASSARHADDDHLVGGAVEVERVHPLGVERRTARLAGDLGASAAVGGSAPRRTRPVKCTVRCGCSLPGSTRSARQPAVGDQIVAVGPDDGLHGQRARFVAVELQRRGERHVLDGDDVVIGCEQPRGLGERLHPHHAGQHRGAVDAMVVQERLLGRIERGRARRRRRARSCVTVTDHRARVGASPTQRVAVDAAVVVVLRGHHAERPGDDHLAVGRARR